MDHIAIMQKRLGDINDILTGAKSIESRWYLSRKSPWHNIKKGETIYFKYPGTPVIAKAKVSKVVEHEYLNPQNVRKILKEFGDKGQLNISNLTQSYNLNKNKKYCILIFLKEAQKIQPFKVDKTGFGISSAWFCTKNITNIKK